ncbi:MAG TPA: methylmalonyl-CoA epimerase [Anaerolineales bacterium]|nr:methylmalonyl-CoA epimerase [Anaerolineales bacterium]
MPTVKQINHVAILVEDLQAPLAFWRDALGLELTHVDNIPAEQAKIAFLPVGDSEIELVCPTTGDSGLARFLAKRGEGMHHICLEVDDITGMLARLKQHGVELINEEPRMGADGRKYAFVHPKSAHGVMVELYELPH